MTATTPLVPRLRKITLWVTAAAAAATATLVFYQWAAFARITSEELPAILLHLAVLLTPYGALAGSCLLTARRLPGALVNLFGTAAIALWGLWVLADLLLWRRNELAGLFMGPVVVVLQLEAACVVAALAAVLNWLGRRWAARRAGAVAASEGPAAG